jgi:hypothetical protein
MLPVRKRLRAPGPQLSLNSKRQVRLRDAADKRLAKFNSAVDIENCTWTANCACCKSDECCVRYDEDDNGFLVQLARSVWRQLSRSSRRQFLKDRTIYVGHDNVELASRKNTKMNSFFLETPAHLFEKLIRVRDGHSTTVGRPGVSQVQFVCKIYFMWMFGFSNNFLYPHHHQLGAGATSTAHDRELCVDPQRATHIYSAIKANEIEQWLRELGKLSIVLPNEDYVVLPYATKKITHAAYVRDEELRLGCPWANRADLLHWDAEYCDMVNVEANDNEEVANPLPATTYRYGNDLCLKKSDAPTDDRIASMSTFYQTWVDKARRLMHFRCRKFIPFAKCDICVEYRKMDSMESSKVAKQVLRKKQGGHIQDIKNERSVYMGNASRAQQNPSSYLSMIIDGADQADFALPHSKERSHATEAAWKLQLKLYGVIVHGVGVWAYTCPPHIGQGNNVTIQAIWDTLLAVLQLKGILPPTLYLQLDNTTKQNKGRYLKAFLGLLVHLGIFKRIIIGYLPVGHTHEDIDQLFSRIAVYLRNHNAYSIESFHRCIRASYHGKHLCGETVYTVHWKTVANISGWLKPYVPTSKWAGLMSFRHFKIVVGDDNQVWYTSRTM